MNFVKASTLVLCLLTFCPSLLFSQTAKAPTAEAKTSKILIGPVAGVNYSWSSFGDSDDRSTFNTTPVFGFHVGGHIAFKVRKRFFLHTSVLYSTKGRIVESKIDPLLRSKSTYKYIDMPIVYTVDFKGKIGENKEFKYFLGIGPNVSYWLGGKGNVNASGLNELALPSLDYKIVFKKDESTLKENEMNVATPNRFQLGLAVTAGIEFEPGSLNRIMLNVRYELGHSYLSKTADGIFATDFNYQEPLQARNQGFRISLAYLIDLKVEQRKKGKSTIKKSNKR